jgi:AbrB family looped-hinge helix DNA binding protein
MAEIIEMGKVSARGQVAIPSEIREKMNLKVGEKVLFVLEKDSLLIKKVKDLSWAEITKPLREAKKKIREEDVVDIIHRMRKKEKQ